MGYPMFILNFATIRAFFLKQKYGHYMHYIQAYHLIWVNKLIDLLADFGEISRLTSIQ
jgi:hypothetical protein